MIRYEQIGERTYKVRYQTRFSNTIGYVSEPEHGRSGWLWCTATSVSGATRYEITHRFREQYARSRRSPYRTRTDATNALLDAVGIVRERVTTPARTTARNGTRGRAFGVEIELTGPSRSLIEAALTAHGIQVRSLHSYTHTNGNMWELKPDGSVSGQCLELASPKLRGPEGFRQLEAVCTALNEVGATVDRTCGLHVHHDMRGLTARQIKRQVLAFVERQHLIRRMVAPSRRGNSYCSEWSPSHTQLLRDFHEARTLREIAYIGPRGAINLQAYAAHGSVEIRFHGGTTNFKKIAGWVRFGQALFAAAEAEVDIPTDSPENLLGVLRNHGLTVEDSATLLRFDRFGETRQQVEASIAAASEMLQEVR